MKRFLFFVFLFPISWLYVQTDFKPGYVITNSNDTLYGEIDYRGDKLMGQRCKFRSYTGDIVEYTPYDIAGYRFTNSKYFVSKEVFGSRTFLEFLIKGQVNIWYIRDDTGEHYFIDKEDMPLTKIPYEEGTRQINGVQTSYRTLEHLRVLNRYMFDAPVVQNQINNMKKPEHKGLIKLAENYHHAVCEDGEPCIVFERKQPIKITVNVASGMAYYYSGKSSFTGGVLLDFWMPRINEKLYLRTGLLHSKHDFDFDYENEPSSYKPSSAYKVPLMVEYIYPKSVIKPKIAYGPGILFFDRKAGMIITCMGGLNVNLGASLGISLEYHADFTELFFIFPKQFISHTFLGGLYYRF